MDAREHLQELVDYFESKRNSAIRASRDPSAQQARIKVEADCYDDALTAARSALQACQVNA